MIYKFYGLSIMLCVIGFSFISTAMIALGGTQPPHPALRGFIEGCEGVPQPCWYGIVPGVTTYQQADTLLRQAGFEVSGESFSGATFRCQAYTQSNPLLVTDVCPINPTTFPTAPVNWVEIEWQRGNLQLGDLVVLLGSPIGVSYDQYGASLQFWFRGTLLVGTDGAINQPVPPMSMFRQVWFASVAKDDMFRGFLWRGWRPLWHYRQFNIMIELN
jgi:hypothetical protein